MRAELDGCSEKLHRLSRLTVLQTFEGALMDRLNLFINLAGQNFTPLDTGKTSTGQEKPYHSDD